MSVNYGGPYGGLAHEFDGPAKQRLSGGYHLILLDLPDWPPMRSRSILYRAWTWLKGRFR